MNLNQYNDLMWDYLKKGILNKSIFVENLNEKLKEKHKEIEKENKYVDNYFLSSFIWEFINIHKKPIRTMNWIQGEHVLLYDWFECSKCGTLVKITDDEDECMYVPVLCPQCNNIKNYPWYSEITTLDNFKQIKVKTSRLKYFQASRDYFDHKYHGYKGWKQYTKYNKNIFNYYWVMLKLKLTERKKYTNMKIDEIISKEKE